MLREAATSADGRPLQSVIRRLRQHVAEEQQAIAGADNATRSFLLADFHVCLAECLGHTLLADMLRDLTARTMLVATLYQSTHDAKQSCAQHAQIVAALEKGDNQRAAALMLAHIGNVENALGEAAPGDGRMRASDCAHRSRRSRGRRRTR